MAVACQNIANGVVGICVGGIPDDGLGQLVLGIIGIGDGAVRIAVGGDVTHAVIGIGIAAVGGQVIENLRHLGGGLGRVDVPVGVALAVDTAGDRLQPPQTVIAHGQGLTRSGGMGIQTAVLPTLYVISTHTAREKALES